MFCTSMKIRFSKYKVMHFYLQHNCDIQKIKLVKMINGFPTKTCIFFSLLKQCIQFQLSSDGIAEALG